jgi:hypothetical protein
MLERDLASLEKLSRSAVVSTRSINASKPLIKWRPAMDHDVVEDFAGFDP